MINDNTAGESGIDQTTFGRLATDEVGGYADGKFSSYIIERGRSSAEAMGWHPSITMLAARRVLRKRVDGLYNAYTRVRAGQGCRC